MTPIYHPRPERWPQVSLKGFFVLVTLLCVFLAWLGVQAKWIRDRNEALKRVHHGVYADGYYKPAPWGIRLLERGVPFIDVDPDVARNSEKVSELKKLFPEATLHTPVDGLPLDHPSHSQGFATKPL